MEVVFLISTHIPLAISKSQNSSPNKASGDEAS